MRAGALAGACSVLEAAVASVIEQFMRAQTSGRRGLFLVTPNTTLVGLGSAEEAVTWLREHHAVILGFEGFRTDGASLEPLLEYIADFSGVEGRPRIASHERQRPRSLC